MSKYYKAEDVIQAIAENLCWIARTEYGDKFTTEDWLEEAEDYVSDLPTIEVSEDCISREWILDEYQTVCATVTCSECPFDDDGGNYCRFADLVMDAPSVVPTTKQSSMVGEWHRVSADKYVQHAYHFYRCSECGEDTIGEPNFCPNCGAKMKGAEEE